MLDFKLLFESSPDVVKSELATFFDAFPDGTIWGNDINGSGYDVVLAGHATPQPIDVDSVDARLSRPEYTRAARSLADVGFSSGLALLSTYAGRARDLAPWLAGAQLNRDSNLRLQYLAGFGLNMYESSSIYSQMLRYRHFPDDVFVGAGPSREQLRAVIEAPREEP